jgi:hypothetical protein
VGCGQKKPQIPSSDDFEMRVMLQCLAQAACKPEGTREMMEAACTYKTCLEMQGAMMTYPSCANWLAEMWAGEELTMEDLGSVIRNKHGNYVCQELVRQASAEALGALFRKLTSKEHLLRDLACHNSGCRMLQRVFTRDDLNDTIAVVVTSLMSVGWKHYLYHRFGNYVIQSILLSNSLDDHQRSSAQECYASASSRDRHGGIAKTVARLETIYIEWTKTETFPQRLLVDSKSM